MLREINEGTDMYTCKQLLAQFVTMIIAPLSSQIYFLILNFFSEESTFIENVLARGATINLCLMSNFRFILVIQPNSWAGYFCNSMFIGH